MNRREFIRHLALSGVGMAAFLWLLYKTQEQNTQPSWPELTRRGILRPPGSLPEEEFLAACIRCQRCSEVCDANAIQLFRPGSGHLEGTPYIIPEVHACNLCLACGDACPTDAILPLLEKEKADMGIAVVDERTCVSHNGTGICGACFTVCPLRGKAITQSAHNKPYVHDACVGCGLCEEACIVKGDKAIRVFSERSWT